MELTQPTDMPEYLESGTQNVPGILALAAGIDFVLAQGVDRIRQKELRHVQLLYDGLSRMGHIKLYTPRPAERYSVPVLSFNVPGMESEAVGALLAAQDIAVRCGLHCAPFAHKKMGTEKTGTVRVSPNVFTKDMEISRFLQAVSRIRPK